MGFSSLTSDVDDIPQISGVEATFYIWAVSRGRGVGFLSYTVGLYLLTDLGGLTWSWCGIPFLHDWPGSANPAEALCHLLS